MTTGEFADLVEKMRNAQRAYFRTHSAAKLEESKTLEKKVDKILADRKARVEESRNPGLFDIVQNL